MGQGRPSAGGTLSPLQPQPDEQRQHEELRQGERRLRLGRARRNSTGIRLNSCADQYEDVQVRGKERRRRRRSYATLQRGV